MDYNNWWLTEELERMRYAEVHRALERERFMRQHGLDLWSVLRSAIARALRRREPAASAPVTAPHDVARRRPRIAA